MKLTTFSNDFRASVGFDTRNDPEREKMLTAACDFINAMANQDTPYSLTMIGGSGIGKTMLAKAIINWVRKHQGLVFPGCWPYTSFLESAACCDRFLGGEYNLPNLMIRDHFVVIDDIGTESDPKGTYRNKLQQVISKRLGSWSVYTSNLSYSQLAQYDRRFASRLIREGGIVVHSEASDYNLETKKKGN